MIGIARYGLWLFLVTLVVACDASVKRERPTDTEYEEPVDVDFEPLFLGSFQSDCLNHASNEFLPLDYSAQEVLAISQSAVMSQSLVIYRGSGCRSDNAWLRLNRRLEDLDFGDGEVLGAAEVSGSLVEANLELLADDGLVNWSNDRLLCGYGNWKERQLVEIAGRQCLGLKRFPLKGRLSSNWLAVSQVGLSEWPSLNSILMQALPKGQVRLTRTTKIVNVEKPRQENRKRPDTSQPGDFVAPVKGSKDSSKVSERTSEASANLSGTWQACVRQQSSSRSSLKTLHIAGAASYFEEKIFPGTDYCREQATLGHITLRTRFKATVRSGGAGHYIDYSFLETTGIMSTYYVREFMLMMPYVCSFGNWPLEGSPIRKVIRLDNCKLPKTRYSLPGNGKKFTGISRRDEDGMSTTDPFRYWSGESQETQMMISGMKKIR